VPTTTAAFVVNNVASDNPATALVPILAGAYLASGTAGGGLTLFGQVTQKPLGTQLTADGTGVARGRPPQQSTAGLAFCDLSKTVTGAWCPLGSCERTANATPGAGLVVWPHGMFTVPPGYAFSLHVLAGAGTSAAYCFAVAWIEVPLTFA